MEKTAEPIALVDMDGTLCDYDGKMREQLAALRAPEEPPLADWDESPHMSARRRMIKRLPGFWEDLAPLDLGFEVLELLRELAFDIHILTKGPADTSGAWAEKVRWCRRHVPDIPITITSDKGLLYGKVLVDDWPPYFLRWLEWRPRGLVVIPAQRWNVEYADHPNCLRYDGHNRAALEARLREVRATAG
ncbi:MAG: hypothetical protein R3A51_19745 [Nannocystaceae bacterium]